ncbi:hypothetical protein [Paenibacillus sp. Marseille-Q4541]|uniref:hypothetical protein n=1 Tax=Paenibacillus sp. Marseille-Q4541 TaxID=2831522 RepID=UPI001BA77387|nr:hypothetical protein [Paenibacillus sp. Marseille-Q4541]
MRKLNEVLVKTGAEVYREIVPVALYSLISSLILLPAILLLPLTVSLIVVPFVYMPLFFGVLHVFHHKLERRSRRSGMRDLLEGAKKGYFAAVIMGLFVSLLVIILWSTWWYYGSKEGMFYTVIALFQTYFVIMAFISQFHTFQLILQKEMGIFRAMGESAKLLFRYPGYTVGAFFQAALLSLLLALTAVGFFVLFNGMMGVYLNKITANVLQEDEQPVNDEWDEGHFGTKHSVSSMK